MSLSFRLSHNIKCLTIQIVVLLGYVGIYINVDDIFGKQLRSLTVWSLNK